MEKRMLSILMVLALCLTLLPTAAWAEESGVASVTIATDDDPTGTTTNYGAFEDALAAANAVAAGKIVTLKLLNDCLVSGDQTVTRSMTLDLGQKKLAGAGGTGSKSLVIDNSATVTIQSDGDCNDAKNAVYLPLFVNGGSNLTVKNGKFLNDTSNSGMLTIEGGIFTQKVKNYGTLIVTGGDIAGVFNNFGTLTIVNGTVENAFSNIGSATINGGTFIGSVSNSYTDTPACQGNLAITGGTFNGIVINGFKAGALTISGGTFNNEIKSYKSGETVQDFLANGYGYRYYSDNKALNEWYQETEREFSPGTDKSIHVEPAPLTGVSVEPATKSLTLGYTADELVFEGIGYAPPGSSDNGSTLQWYLGTAEEGLFAEGNKADSAFFYFWFPAGKGIGTYYVGCTLALKGYTVKSNIATVMVNKAQRTIDVSISGWTYGDSASAPTVTGVTDTVTYEYKLKTAADDTYSTAVPTNAGEYTVRATVAETDTHAAASDTADFTIVPKAATITALDKTGRVYDSAPDLSSPVVDEDYTIDGLLEGDTVAVTLTCDADMNRQGEYDIVPSATDPNYTFTCVPGKLTLNYRPITLRTYSITVLTTTNGTIAVWPENAVAGATITITITPDKGYTLETLTALDKNGKEIELTNKGDGKYTFIMPAGKVTVTATFMEDNSMLNFFVDVPAAAYYYDAVLWAAENGITGGIDENHFGPDLSCTRAQLVTFLWRAAGCPVVNDPMGFTDVGNSYYTEAVRWAASMGIVDGYGNGLFGSDDTITREQMATILYRFAQAMDMDTTQSGMAVREFADYESISSYAAKAMQWAVNAGILQGAGGKLMPAAPCTRAQIVTMLHRLLK